MSLAHEPTSANQQQLWDELHALRDSDGNLVGRSLVDEPNELAINLGERLVDGSSIVEVGCANGRDARYWALHKGMLVHALDFSQAAIDQLRELAEDQGVGLLIQAGLFDASEDSLPVDIDSQDAFYARSSLHVTSYRLTHLLRETHNVLHLGGIVAIEGKHIEDPKIKRSISLDPDDPFLLSDPLEGGHIRRAWEPEYTRHILKMVGFEITDLEVINEHPTHGEPSVFTRVIAVKT